MDHATYHAIRHLLHTAAKTIHPTLYCRTVTSYSPYTDPNGTWYDILQKQPIKHGYEGDNYITRYYYSSRTGTLSIYTPPFTNPKEAEFTLADPDLHTKITQHLTTAYTRLGGTPITITELQRLQHNL